MARAGVTYHDVAQAAHQLTEQGKNPTIEAVRSLLNTGSNTTLSKHLNQWRQQQQGITTAARELPETLVNAVKGLHQAITSEAELKIEQLEVAHAKTVQDLQSELESLQQKHNKISQINRQLEQDKVQLIDDKAALKRYIEGQKDNLCQQQQEIHLLNERLCDKKADIENLHQQLKNAQTNLEHYREMIRQEREQERLNFESKVTQLERSLRTTEVEFANSKATAAKLQENCDTLTSQLHNQVQLVKEFQTNHQQLELTYNLHLQTHQQLQEQYDTLQVELQSAVAQAQNDRNTLQVLVVEIAQKEEQVQALQHALIKAENRVTTLSDKNLFLIQEKADLAATLSHYKTIT